VGTISFLNYNTCALTVKVMFLAPLPDIEFVDIELALRNRLTIFVILSFSLYFLFAFVVLLVSLQDFSFICEVPLHLNLMQKS